MRIIRIMIFEGSEELVISHSFVLLQIFLVIHGPICAIYVFLVNLKMFCTIAVWVSVLVLGTPTPMQFEKISLQSININGLNCENRELCKKYFFFRKWKLASDTSPIAVEEIWQSSGLGYVKGGICSRWVL